MHQLDVGGRVKKVPQHIQQLPIGLNGEHTPGASS
jgi:hypothetical protein